MAHFNRVQFLISLISDLQAHITGVVTNCKLTSLKESIACTAPELLNSRLYELYNILRFECADNAACKRIYHESLFLYYDIVRDGQIQP